MTLEEVQDLCQVPLEVLVTELGLPEDVDTRMPMRDLAGQLGIEVTTVREIVERYQAEH
jgi:DNA-binding Lrp family transcriptional regulator